jgi:hypothetical protein
MPSRTQKERSWNRQRPAQDAAPLHQILSDRFIGSFDRHDASATKNSVEPRWSNFNGVTRAFVTK